MAAAVNADDVVLLYFAGHGKVSIGEEMFYLYRRMATTQICVTLGVNTAMIADALRHLAALAPAIILDVCQSGAAIEALT